MNQYLIGHGHAYEQYVAFTRCEGVDPTARAEPADRWHASPSPRFHSGRLVARLRIRSSLRSGSVRLGSSAASRPSSPRSGSVRLVAHAWCTKLARSAHGGDARSASWIQIGAPPNAWLHERIAP